MIHIACVFHNTAPLVVPPEQLAKLLQKYVTSYLGPVWGVEVSIAVAPSVPAGSWGLIFTDNADQAGALGYHETTAEGLPIGHVFVQTSRAAGAGVALVATHELAEMVCDPYCCLGALSPRSHWVAYEVCDPVEGESFLLDGIAVSDFVTPAWFGGGGKSFDLLGHCRQPWQILPGGYAPVYANGRWGQLFGSQAAGERWQGEDQRLHRPARRLLAAAGLSHTQALALSASAGITFLTLLLLLIEHGPALLQMLRRLIPNLKLPIPVPALAPRASSAAG